MAFTGAIIGGSLLVGSMAGKGKVPDPLGIHSSLGLPDPLALMEGSKESEAIKAAQQQPTLMESSRSNVSDEEAARLQREKQRKRAAAGTGRSDTVATGPQGLGEVGAENREVKTLLGY